MRTLRGIVIAAVLLPGLCVAQGQPKEETLRPPNDRVKIPQWNFVNVFAGVVTSRGSFWTGTGTWSNGIQAARPSTTTSAPEREP